ncbi:MAG: Tryptophan synthase alpha chain [Candidatus Ordinivivax streblomastigis]|uniref:Tryptophan synthase alpha chain n=1 Tax=Candidatus Ordinivivax streblomastigis TaxID=2540710 RepID=A0A5M8NZY6_9BACT|nr:MAG: Tryptophan synthase alpha chain [Candidatus Ordinivivax streblomastigis]
MNKINRLFQQKPKEILSVYFTAGFPQLNDTPTIIKALQAGGIHLIEVGIPFSDPMADGPVIQKSSTKALQNGMSLKLLFKQLETIQHEVHIPLILMGYLNPIMQYGFENFCRDCRQAGVSGMIIPDLPFNDYINDYQPIADRYDLKVIMLITPETSDERIRLIDGHTDGFIYMVSSAATTGAQTSFDEQKQAYFRKINGMHLRNPRLIGFGISNHATLQVAFENASGAIIGSKFVSLLAETKNPDSAVKKLLNDLLYNQ